MTCLPRPRCTRRPSLESANSRASTSTLSSTAHVPKKTKTSKAVDRGRILFVLSLCTLALLMGFLANFLMTLSEERLATVQFEALADQYNSIADRALDAALGIIVRKRLGTISLATFLSHSLPNADAWPFVTLPGFEEITRKLIDTSSGNEMAFGPMVSPEQLSAFEDFAYDFFENQHVPPFPNGTGITCVGKGVFGMNFSSGTSCVQYRVTDGNTVYNSPYKVIVPILQHSLGASPALMADLHSEEIRGTAIDRMIECARLRMKSGELVECGLITSALYFIFSDESQGPGANMLQPVFPANNITTMTGVVGSSLLWSEVLDVFSGDVNGIDCVLETDTTAYTYSVVDGSVNFIGEGDLHMRAYDTYRRSVSLTPEEYFSNLSANFTLAIYPSTAFYTVYSSEIALQVTIGAVCIILFISALFLVYDSCVRRDITAKNELLEAKRAFVRFVSHEVRTPLNSVCMGLTLMQEEIAKSAGCKSVHELDSKAIIDQMHPETTAADSSSLACFRLSKEIHANVIHSVGVLNDLLNYDKIEMGNLKLELKVIPLQELIERTVLEFSVPAAQKKLDLTIAFGQVDEQLKNITGNTSVQVPSCARDCVVVGDDIRLRQVMRNLLSNAIKFTPENGSIRICASWVKLSGKKKERGLNNFIMNSGAELSIPRCGWIKVAVKDSGAGMTADQVSRVFGAGVQFNANELQGGNGTGIGLHIAKGIMEQHGGTLQVSSSGLGEGSTFAMKIPIHLVPQESDMADVVGYDHEIDLEAQTDYEPLPLKVLVVDDAAMNRKLLARLLRNHGHQCDEAEDGAVAVNLVEQAIEAGEPYDTVLLDNEMPVMNGPLAAERMREMGSDVFIVGVTGNLLAEDVAHFKAMGADVVLPKPFKMSDLDNLWMEYGVYGESTKAPQSTHSKS